MPARRKAIVAMSGGVDSSVAAALLSREYEVIGLHVTKAELSRQNDCLRERNRASAESASSVAETLGIPLMFVEAGRCFDELVGFFCSEYNAGRTPNPCVACNIGIKWRILLEVAEREGADFVATGHYARLMREGSVVRLVRSAAGRKDQTYFLHRLTQRELGRTLFPLAEFSKERTRALARELSLPSFEREESQDICFVGQAGYREILEARTPEAIRPGEVVDLSGRVIGRHEGYQFYTIGQRKGLRIALGKPAYVVDIDAASARVVLGGEEDILCAGLVAADVNWIVPPAPEKPFEATVRVRYSHAGATALVKPQGSKAAATLRSPDTSGRSTRVEFDEPVRAVTPGQAAVFYVGDEVVGGGWIAGRG